MAKNRVCLINPPTRSSSFRPPHGLMYLASYLAKQGIEARLIDQKGDIPIDILIKEAVDEAAGIEPDFVGISCLTTDVRCVFEIADRLKSALPDAKVIAGGVHPTLFPQQMLENKSIDFVVLGEGEHTLYELVRSRGENGLCSIEGIAYRDNGSVVINPRRHLIENLDEIPLPAFEKINMDFYLQPNIHLVRGIPLRGFYVFSTRGCPFGCRFCVSKNVFGRTIRFRTPSKVADEIEYLHRNYGIDGFYLFDDTFGVKKSHSLEFCAELKGRRLPIVWGCETRANLMTEELARGLKSAGCIQVDFGIESGSQRLLKLIQKGITIAQIKDAVSICKRHKIRVFSNFMINLPTETEEDFYMTLSLADKLKSDISIFNVTCPFPGTELDSFLKEKLAMDDYPKMSSMVSYNTYIDFLESKCRLSAHNIPIREMLARIQETVPLPREMRLRPNMKYMTNFLRYFNFVMNPRYIKCMLKTKNKKEYIEFARGMLDKQNVSPTKL